MNIPVFENQMTRIIPSFAGFTEFTTSVPKIYWDVKSQEQRILGICQLLGKVIAYSDMLGENVDEIAKTLQDIEDGKLDDMITAAIEAWFDENEPEIMSDIAALEAMIGTGFDAEHTIADAVSTLNGDMADVKAVTDTIGDGFTTENTVTDAFGLLSEDVDDVESDIQDLSNRVLELEQTNYSYSGWDGWSVLLNNDAFVASKLVQKTVTEKNVYSTIAQNVSFSEDMKIAAPMPFNTLVLAGTSDRALQWISNVNPNGNVGCTFKILTPYDFTPPINPALRIILMGIIRKPPKNAPVSYNAVIGQQIANIGLTYYNAMLNGRKFGYGRNFFYTSLPNDVINDSNGRGMMECDTFVGMCLRGIPYIISPYSVETADYHYAYEDLYADVSGATNWAANTVYNQDDLVVTDDYYYWKCIQAHTSSSTFNESYWEHVWITNPYSIAWATSENAAMHPANVYLGRDILYAGDVAFLGWQQSRVFSDIEQAFTGDVAIWVRRAKTPTYWGGTSQSPAFDNVGHVGIMIVENGERYILHVTGDNVFEKTVINKTPIEDFGPEMPSYFYRPLYS